MLSLLLVTTLFAPADIAARSAERNATLKPTLQALDFDPAKAAAAEELLKTAPTMECLPIRGTEPQRCGQQLPTGDPVHCWQGAIMAAIYQRQLQMETGDVEGLELLFACGGDIVSGAIHSEVAKNGRLSTTITLTRRGDGKTASAPLSWQPVKLPKNSPIHLERKVQLAQRDVQLAILDYTTALQAGRAGEVKDATVAACAKARAQLLAIPIGKTDDDSYRQAMLRWIAAVEADHASGVLHEMASRGTVPRADQATQDEARTAGIAKTGVTSSTPLAALPMKVLADRYRQGVGARDSDLAAALQRYRANNPFTPAP